MKKGKHVAKRFDNYKKRKLNKKKILLFALILALLIYSIYCLINNLKKEGTKESGSQEVKQEQIKEGVVEIKETEDEDVKNLIANTMQVNNLNEKNFAFFYYNVETKQYYFYNQDTYFTAASTVKLPVAMMYYDRINNGELSKDSTITYKKGCYEPGSGSTDSKYLVGDKVPLEFLVQQSIIYSDNTAVNILIKNIGQKEYRYEMQKYCPEELPEEFFEKNVTSATYSYNVVKYLYEHEDQYLELIELAKKSSNGGYLKKYIKDYDVAHKYGSYDGNVHDYGIVYTPKPYLIGVFTKGVKNAEELIANINSEIIVISQE